MALLLMPYQYCLSFGKSADGLWGSEAGRRLELVAQKMEAVQADEVWRQLIEEEDSEPVLRRNRSGPMPHSIGRVASASSYGSGGSADSTLPPASASTKSRKKNRDKIKKNVRSIVEHSVIGCVFDEVDRRARKKERESRDEKRKVIERKKAERRAEKEAEKKAKETTKRSKKNKKKKGKKAQENVRAESSSEPEPQVKVSNSHLVSHTQNLR